MKVVTLASGGLDSTVLVYYLLHQGHVPSLLFIDYGQRHHKEGNYVTDLADHLQLDYRSVRLDLRLGSSALTNPATELTSVSSVVPNRNAIFANVAAAVVIDTGADAIALAMHAGDHSVYKDCRPVFVDALRTFFRFSLDDEVEVLTPFMHLSKAAVVMIGHLLGVPFEKTWSCYEGRERHCGVCSACEGRRNAFAQLGLEDPTHYELPF